MKISAGSKISDIIKEYPEAIDAIATINKHFKRLQNPVLRKVLANRITVKDAAKIGGVSVDTFLDRLASIGIEIEKHKDENVKIPDKNTNGDIFENKELVELDARKYLDKGIDPFKAIMNAIKSLQNNQVLKIINTFEPLPIIKVLSERGFDYKVERKDNLVNTYFSISGKTVNHSPESIGIVEDNPELFDKYFEHFKENIEEIDVRNLEMPMPMVTILENLESMAKDKCLFVHHKRIPQFLLKELQERGYSMVGKKIDESNIKLLIFKK